MTFLDGAVRLGSLLFFLAAASCGRPPVVSRAASALSSSSGCAARDFGAAGDGVADDRPAIQAALDACAGREVYLAPGSYLASQAPLRNYALRVPARTALRGAGQESSTILLAPGSAPSTQLLWVEDAPGVTLQELTLDGQRAAQGPPTAAGPQRHGVFVKRSPGFSAKGVTARRFAGDGFYLYAGSDHASLSGVSAVDNDRDGATLGGQVDGVVATGSTFARNGQDGWHSEGSGSNDGVTLAGDTFAGNAGFAVTASGVGADAASRSRRWTIVDSVVDGPVAIVYADDVLYARNRGTNASGLPSVLVYRQLDRVRIEDNVLAATGAATSDSVSVVSVVGTGAGQSPGGVVVARNTLTTTHPQFGVSVVCARDAQILDNAITGSAEGVGPHSSGLAGVFVRATRVDVPVTVAVRGNVVSGFGAYSLMLGGNGAAKIASVAIDGNSFSQPVSLDDGLHEALDVSVSGAVVATPPSGTLTAGAGQRWVVP